MSYLNSVSLIAFVGADAEQRQGRSNEWGSKVEWHRGLCYVESGQQSIWRSLSKALTGHLGSRVAKAMVAPFSS